MRRGDGCHSLACLVWDTPGAYIDESRGGVGVRYAVGGSLCFRVSLDTLGMRAAIVREACLADVVGRVRVPAWWAVDEGPMSRNRSDPSEVGRGILWRAFPFVVSFRSRCRWCLLGVEFTSTDLQARPARSKPTAEYNLPLQAPLWILQGGTHRGSPTCRSRGEGKTAVDGGPGGRRVPHVRRALYDAVTTVSLSDGLESCAPGDASSGCRGWVSCSVEQTLRRVAAFTRGRGRWMNGRRGSGTAGEISCIRRTRGPVVLI